LFNSGLKESSLQVNFIYRASTPNACSQFKNMEQHCGSYKWRAIAIKTNFNTMSRGEEQACMDWQGTLYTPYTIAAYMRGKSHKSEGEALA
jgi:hypothetical protein